MSEPETSSARPVTIAPGRIQFFEACHPPLVAGEYRLRLSQVVRESETASIPWNSAPYTSELRFAVGAPRFTLSPADIHSVYPPSHHTGHFDNALPHVVFTRRTLPWERTLDGTAPRYGQPFPTWLGLLLFEEEELRQAEHPGRSNFRPGEIRSLPVFDRHADSLLVPADPGVLAPELGQSGAGEGDDPAAKQRAAAWVREEGQWARRSCLAMEVPADLFKAVAPRREDLPYLAHARQVDTGDKEVAAINDRGWFSLVIGNRVPQPDRAHRAVLISLEGLQRCLEETWTPAPGGSVRFAVLGSWSFACEGTSDFKARLGELAVGPLRLPSEPFREDSRQAGDIVAGALARGYTACDHVLRHGERTVSWYRGPLVPLSHVRSEQTGRPPSGADELLRYDPDTGLFDVTYAAAWQLGRLLALQNRGFALALSRLRAALRHTADRRMSREGLETLRRKAGLPEGESMADSLMRHLSRSGGDQLRKAVPGAAPAALESASTSPEDAA